MDDLHTGHHVSICPPKVKYFENGEDVEHHASEGQKKEYEIWNGIRKELGRIDFVIANGDLCEGSNPKEEGLGNWTNDVTTQVTVAADLLKELRAKKYFITRGSGYHVRSNPNLDRLVAVKLSDWGLSTEYDTDLAINVSGENYRIHASHWLPVSSNFAYRSTAIAGELMAARLNEQEYGSFDLLARAHTHYFAQVRFGKQCGVVVPGFKGKDDYLKLKGLKFTPKWGYYAIEIDHGEVVEEWVEVQTPDRGLLVKDVHA